MAKYLQLSETEAAMNAVSPEVTPWVGANNETNKVRYVAKQA